MNFKTKVLTAAILSISVNTAFASTLSNGDLTLDIRDDNGAIDAVNFNGDWYDQGTHVSDWGMQITGDSGSFSLNDTYGNTQISTSSVVDLGDFIKSTSLYTASGANIEVTRLFSLIDGLNAYRVSTTFTNYGSDLSLRIFETFDPDPAYSSQGDFETFMDVETLSGLEVAEAWTNYGHAVVMGGDYDVVASGNPFQIDYAGALDSVLTSPYDANGALLDEGIHIASEFSIAKGQQISLDFIMAYGSDLESAQNTYLQANNVSPIPEPSTYALMLGGLGLVGFMATRRRKQA